MSRRVGRAVPGYVRGPLVRKAELLEVVSLPVHANRPAGLDGSFRMDAHPERVGDKVIRRLQEDLAARTVLDVATGIVDEPAGVQRRGRGSVAADTVTTGPGAVVGGGRHRGRPGPLRVPATVATVGRHLTRDIRAGSA
jgi:hypothetical protein